MRGGGEGRRGDLGRDRWSRPPSASPRARRQVPAPARCRAASAAACIGLRLGPQVGLPRGGGLLGLVRPREPPRARCGLRRPERREGDRVGLGGCLGLRDLAPVPPRARCPRPRRPRTQPRHRAAGRRSRPNRLTREGPPRAPAPGRLREPASLPRRRAREQASGDRRLFDGEGLDDRLGFGLAFDDRFWLEVSRASAIGSGSNSGSPRLRPRRSASGSGLSASRSSMAGLGDRFVDGCLGGPGGAPRIGIRRPWLDPGSLGRLRLIDWLRFGLRRPASAQAGRGQGSIGRRRRGLRDRIGQSNRLGLSRRRRDARNVIRPGLGPRVARGRLGLCRSRMSSVGGGACGGHSSKPGDGSRRSCHGSSADQGSTGGIRGRAVLEVLGGPVAVVRIRGWWPIPRTAHAGAPENIRLTRE